MHIVKSFSDLIPSPLNGMLFPQLLPKYLDNEFSEFSLGTGTKSCTAGIFWFLSVLETTVILCIWECLLQEKKEAFLCRYQLGYADSLVPVQSDKFQSPGKTAALTQYNFYSGPLADGHWKGHVHLWAISRSWILPWLAHLKSSSS